jgi:hypothetical protein
MDKKMLKEFEKEVAKAQKNGAHDDDSQTKQSEEQKEEYAKSLKKAANDTEMLAGKDGNVYRVEEIDFIIKDVLKHQHKVFKLKRDIEDLKEAVVEVEGFKNHLEERHFVPHDSAALKYTDDEYISSQRGVLFHLVKQIGLNILSGKSIMNVSLPIKIFEP